MARVKEADGQARIAGAPLLPSVEVAPEAAAIHQLAPIGRERHYGNFTGEFIASYQLDVWGKNHAALDAAKSSASAARYARQVVELTTVAGVATTYIQILALQDQLATTQAQLDAAQTLLDDLQAKQRAGLATELEVANQQVVVQGLQQALAPLQAVRAHALDALAILTGQSPETLQIQGKSLSELKVPAPAGGLPSQLLAHRPDVQQAERQLEAAHANVKVARTEFLPQFDLSAAVGIQAMGMANGFTGVNTLYNLAFGAVQPIFEGGKLKGQLQFAKSREAELLADYIQATRQAYSDVEDALASVRSAQAQQAAAQAALDKSETALKLTQSGLSGRDRPTPFRSPPPNRRRFPTAWRPSRRSPCACKVSWPSTRRSAAAGACLRDRFPSETLQDRPNTFRSRQHNS